MRGSAVLAVLGVALGGMTSSALAAPGDFHTSYLGGDGFAAVSYGTEVSYTDSSQGCGSLIAGTTVVGGVRRPILTKLTSTGAVDTAFGTSGHKVDTTIPTSVQPYSAMLVQTHLGGWPNFTGTSYVFQVVSTTTDIYVYKFACTNGAQQWRQQINFASGAVAPQFAIWGNEIVGGSTPAPIVIAAAAKPTSTALQDAVLIKMNASGALDTAFGTNGRVYVHALDQNRFTAIAATSWGYCGIGRARTTTTPFDVLVACVNSGTGALNTSFAGDGMLTFNFGDGSYPQAFGRAVVWDTSTMTLAANVCDPTGAVCKLGAARVTSTGALDTTFDGDGKALLSLSSFGTTVGTARLATINTRTYVSGQYFKNSDGSDADAFIFAMTSSGVGDTTFGTNGLRTYNNGTTGLEGYGGMSVNGNSALFFAGDRDISGVPKGVAAMHVP